MNDERLQRAVDAQSEPAYMRSKADIWEYYLDKNNGDRRAAASEAARELSGESSGKAYRSARRNFEGSRADNITRGNTAKWREFGEKLPSIGKKPTGDSITVTIKGTMEKEGGGTRQRTITRTFTGSDAYDFVNNPDYDTFWSDYGIDLTDIGSDEYALVITSVS